MRHGYETSWQSMIKEKNFNKMTGYKNETEVIYI